MSVKSDAGLVLAICMEISRGLIIVTRNFSVGPYRRAVGAEWIWACLDRQGDPVLVTHRVPHLVAVIGLPYPLDLMRYRVEDREEQDWSAFGAARAFVKSIGPGPARRALNASIRRAA